jgi:hypothetical protein
LGALRSVKLEDNPFASAPLAPEANSGTPSSSWLTLPIILTGIARETLGIAVRSPGSSWIDIPFPAFTESVRSAAVEKLGPLAT